MRVIQPYFKCKLTALIIFKLNHNLFDIYGGGALKRTELDTSHMIDLRKKLWRSLAIHSRSWVIGTGNTHTHICILFDFVASRLCNCKLLSSTSTLILDGGRSKKMWEDRG